MKTARALLVTMLFFFALAIPAVAMAGAVGKITALNGNVDVVKPGQKTAIAAGLMQPVSEGDIIRTKSYAKVEITFADKSAVRLAPGSRLEITKYLLQGNERKESALNLSRGKMRVIVAGPRKILGVSFSGGQKFEVQTPVAVADAKGTDFFIFHMMGVTGVVVKDGKVNAFNRVIHGQVVPVSAGNATFVTKNKAPQPSRPAADIEIIRHSNDTNTKTGKEKDEPTDADILNQEAAITSEGVYGFSKEEPQTFETTSKSDTPAPRPISEPYPNLLPKTGATPPSPAASVSFLGETNDFDDYYYGSLFISDGTGLYTRGVSSGATLDGAATPWSGAASVNFHGPYNDFGAKKDPYVWLSDIYSGKSGSGYRTYDNGAFFGVIGGVWQNQAIDGRLYSLYVDPSGNAGILTGSLAGNYYPDTGMFSASGTWTPTALASGLAPSSLGDLTYASSLFMNPWYGSNGNLDTNSGVTAFTSEYEARTFNISGQNWGIWEAVTGGAGSSVSNTWRLLTEYKSTDNSLIFGTEVEGTQWSGGKLYGATYGYGADISSTPTTWIAKGETIGTFNPIASTWQAAQVGAYIETNKFLSMAQTAQGRAALQQLNIPFVEVGRANLTGTNGNLNVNMNNVIFFAYQTGAAPKIWATGDVNGAYLAAPAAGNAVALAGNGLNANFNVKAFDASAKKWTATVDGGGSYSGTGTMNGSNVQMNGAAAGTNTGAGPGTFSGTGAGVAQ